MTTEHRIEKLERQQQQLVACTMALAGIVLEYAKRDLGGEGPAGLTGDMVASKGLLLLGHNKPCPTGAEVVERVAQVLNLLRDEPLPFVRRAFELMEDEDGSKELEDFLMSFDQIPEDLRP